MESANKYTPGEKITLRLSNGYEFTVTVVRVGKARVTVEIPESTSDSGTHYPAWVKAYDFATFEGLRK